MHILMQRDKFSDIRLERERGDNEKEGERESKEEERERREEE